MTCLHRRGPHAAPSSFTVKWSHAPVCRLLNSNNKTIPSICHIPSHLVTSTYRIASSKANVALDTTPRPTNLPSAHPPVLSRSSATVKMPNAKKNNPAVWIGGQRRKIARKPGTNTAVPRSSTMPAINPDSAAASLVSSVSGLGAGISSDGLAVEDRNRNQYEEMDPEDYYPPPSRVTQ
jgi:hypothetical protein